MMLKLTALGLLAGAAIIGCGGSSGGGGNSSSTSKPASSAPKGEVRFVSPKNGAKTSGTVTAKVALKDFHISPKTVGQAPRPGQGHLHFKLDEGKFDTPKYDGLNGQLGKKLGVTGKYSPSITPSITYSKLPAGKHVLEVYLANNNHTDVGVEAKVAFLIR